MSENPVATYTATWERSGTVIFEHRPAGDLLSELPAGAYPESSSNDQDPWLEAWFCVDGMDERIVVRRDDPARSTGPTIHRWTVDVLVAAECVAPPSEWTHDDLCSALLTDAATIYYEGIPKGGL